MTKCSVLVIAAVVSISLPSVAAAHGGNDDPNAIHACIHTVNKNVRIVGATGSCHVAETPTHWNIGGSSEPETNGARVFRYMTFDTFLEACCWNAANDASLFGGVPPSAWTDGAALASEISSDSDVLRTLFVRKLHPGNNALVSAERWSDQSSTNGKVTAVLMRIRNSTPAAINWQPSFYFTAHASWGEAASVALNGANVWNSIGDHYNDSTMTLNLALPANQTSTVIFVVPSSPPWFVSGFFRMNFFAFYNNSLSLPPGLSFVDDLDKVTGSLWP